VRIKQRTCNHPEFIEAVKGAYPVVFIFQRSCYIKPTEQQRLKYQEDKSIVEAHGGRMRLEDFEIGGKSLPFTEEDVRGAIVAVKTSNPDLKVVSHWNGEGGYCLRIGCKYQLL